MALEGVSGQRHVPAALYPRERPGTHCIGGWVGPRDGLDRCRKSRPPPTGIRSPDRPARSQSLYRLHYPAHNNMEWTNKNETVIRKTTVILTLHVNSSVTVSL